MLALAAVCPLFSSCENNDLPDPDYYVRYHIITDPDHKCRFHYRDVSGENKLVQMAFPTGEYSVTVGPVKKGFEAYTVASYDDGGAVRLLSIEVAEGSESAPFVIKKSGTNYISLEYKLQ